MGWGVWLVCGGFGIELLGYGLKYVVILVLGNIGWGLGWVWVGGIIGGGIGRGVRCYVWGDLEGK